jgi:hypothetical protein
MLIVKDLKKEKVCPFHLLILDQNHQRTLLSVEFGEMIDDGQNALKIFITGNESSCVMYGPETEYQSAALLSPKTQKVSKIRMQK